MLPLTSAKRTAVERSGPHSWHPYYAGYSESFVGSALRYLGCHEETTLLDPWGGSGTTGIVAARSGIPSICIDVNPVMATFAAAKSRQVLAHREELLTFFDNLDCAELSIESHIGRDDALANIFTPETVNSIRYVANGVTPERFSAKSESKDARQVRKALDDPDRLINLVQAFCLSVMFVSLRKLSGVERSSNPTWLKSRDEKAHVSPSALFAALRSDARKMLTDLEAYFGVERTIAPNYSLHGDARHLPVRDASVDAVITSPPYLTRIDYAMATMPEMYLLGDGELLKRTRHQTMGAPVITRSDKYQKESWGATCNAVLDAVKAHPTKAAMSYYWKNIVQYFIDLDLALDEMRRVLAPRGEALLVVQTSYFKDIEIPLGLIYCEMAEGKGLDAAIVYEEEVRGHIAHVNTKSSQYKKNKVYREEVVHLTKSYCS